MKTIKILLGIIAINLTLLTIIQTGIWPPKVQASETKLLESNSISNEVLFPHSGMLVHNGYIYAWRDGNDMRAWVRDQSSTNDGYYQPTKRKLP